MCLDEQELHPNLLASKSIYILSSHEQALSCHDLDVIILQTAYSTMDATSLNVNASNEATKANKHEKNHDYSLPSIILSSQVQKERTATKMLIQNHTAGTPIKE